MLSIYKYGIEPKNEITIELPMGAKVLNIQMQHNVPQIWCLVDPSAEMEKRSFRLFGTGHEINESGENLLYINTFQMYEDNLVFHLFELINN